MAKTAALAALMVLAGAGCAAFNRQLDRIAEVMVNQVEDYCRWPQHRRWAVWTFVNGELGPTGHQIDVHCAGDQVEPQ